MKLHDAKVCVECDEVIEADVIACPSCTCTSFIYLSAKVRPILTREQIDQLRERRRTETEEAKSILASIGIQL